MLIESRLVINQGALIILLFIGLSSLLFVPRSLEFSKNIYRAFRSEAHLVKFIFQRDPKEAPARMPTLQKDTYQEVAFIAHATGNVHGKPALDSYEGLEASVANGCKCIEAEFEWTSDNYLV